MLKLYNTLTRKKEAFKPIKKNLVTAYVCGPTTYDYGHLGHGRSSVAFDLLHRYLVYKGYQVKFVFNYTDIDDKIIKRARKEKVSVKQLTDKFAKIYDEDYQKLNLLKPYKKPKATQHIKEMVDLIKILKKKGYIYLIENDGLYFDVLKFKQYGKLSHQKLGDLKAGARIKVEAGKKTPYDFVLWKFQKPGEPAWNSPWGEGRPGWNIECSAMSMKYLGNTIDIHGGGQDLIFPHHECEIAQSEAATGKPFAHYWLHNGFVTIGGEKMSKSLGNFLTLRDIFKEHSPLTVRYFFLSAHYRAPLNFTKEALEGAKNSLEKLQQAFFDLNEVKAFGKKTINLGKYIKQFELALDDDLNISPALAAVFELINEINKNKLSKGAVKDALDFFKKVDSVLGVLVYKKEAVPQKVLSLVKLRETARMEKDWKKADEIREKIKKLGYLVEDTEEGAKVKKI